MFDKIESICKEAIGTPKKKMDTGKKLMFIGGLLIVISYAIPYLIR